MQAAGLPAALGIHLTLAMYPAYVRMVGVLYHSVS
jgi:hypothetical protein